MNLIFKNPNFNLDYRLNKTQVTASNNFQGHLCDSIKRSSVICMMRFLKIQGGGQEGGAKGVVNWGFSFVNRIY